MTNRPNTPRPRAAAALTALDWIGVALAGTALLGLLVAPRLAGPAFTSMFEDLGATLPLLTRMAIAWWPFAALALAPLALLLVALLRRTPVRRARLLVTLSFVLSMGFLALLAYGLYAPVFDLAGAVEATPPG